MNVSIVLFSLVIAADPAAPPAAAKAPDKPATAAQQLFSDQFKVLTPGLGSIAQSAAWLKNFRDEFVHITPGKGKFPQSFKMGDATGTPQEQPVHEVTFAYDFHISRYEVTQHVWQEVMGENPSKWKGDRNSVEMLTYDDAVQFCQRMTKLLRDAKLIAENEQVRLPSEAEWEYCTRAGTTTRYSFGDNAKNLGAFGWFTGNAKGNDPPVGMKFPNPFGLADVHGYLWEWCSDDWHDSYKGAPTDGSAWIDPATKDNDPSNDKSPGKGAPRRVLRSGSWKDPDVGLRSGFRMAVPANVRDDAVGLRCVIGKAKSK